MSFNLSAQSIAEVENNVANALSRLNYWEGKYEHENHYDSLEYWNMKAVQLLVGGFKNNPAALKAKYAKLDSIPGVGIYTSEDGMVKFFCWDDNTGGTMRTYSSVILYKTATGVKAKQFCPPAGDTSEFILCPYIRDLHSFKTTSHGTIYVLTNFYKGSSIIGANEVTAFKIDADSIMSGLSVFRAKMKTLTSISCGFDLSKAQKASRERNWLIEWDNDKNIFYVPLIDKDNYITGKYFRYKFDGDYFVYDKTVKYEEIKSRIR